MGFRRRRGSVFVESVSGGGHWGKGCGKERYCPFFQ